MGCLVAWDKATRPKDQGGSGVINLRAQNIALLVKFLHKLYNKKKLPWVQLTWNSFYNRPIPPHHRKGVGSFWWRDIMTLYNFFMMATCSANMGDTTYF
jgi:hypothetical protein